MTHYHYCHKYCYSITFIILNTDFILKSLWRWDRSAHVCLNNTACFYHCLCLPQFYSIYLNFHNKVYIRIYHEHKGGIEKTIPRIAICITRLAEWWQTVFMWDGFFIPTVETPIWCAKIWAITWVLILITKIPLNTHADLFSNARDLNFGPSLLCIWEHRRLCRVCTFAQALLSLSRSIMW